jgi:hypothetical protein
MPDSESSLLCYVCGCGGGVGGGSGSSSGGDALGPEPARFAMAVRGTKGRGGSDRSRFEHDANNWNKTFLKPNAIGFGFLGVLGFLGFAWYKWTLTNANTSFGGSIHRGWKPILMHQQLSI